jgi:hypothetical protein
MSELVIQVVATAAVVAVAPFIIGWLFDRWVCDRLGEPRRPFGQFLRVVFNPRGETE